MSVEPLTAVHAWNTTIGYCGVAVQVIFARGTYAYEHRYEVSSLVVLLTNAVFRILLKVVNKNNVRCGRVLPGVVISQTGWNTDTDCRC